MSDHWWTIESALKDKRRIVGDTPELNAALDFVRQMREPLDTPDGPGWWAFEGHVFTGIGESVKLQWVVDVSLNGINNKLYAHSTSGHSKPVGLMIGKWYRLTMPWDDAQPKEGDNGEG